MGRSSLQQTFTAALDALVTQVKDDRAILAAILCGSLSHDVVWAKSDIDLLLVTVDDKNVARSDIALDADGVNVHTALIPRTEFRKIVEGSVHNSFMHSLLAKGQLLYTHDRTIADLCARLDTIGSRDRTVQLFRAGMNALGPIDKAHKWLVTRGDLEYASLWILYAATPLAQVEMISAGRLLDREVIPQAMSVNPKFFRTIYANLLNERKTRRTVQAALDAVDEYVASRAPALFALVVDYLRDAGEVRSASEIDVHFKKHFDLDCATIACEYLADRGLIGKASTSVRLTRRSTIDVQELAFYFVAEPLGAA
jgi:uncharacterized protein